MSMLNDYFDTTYQEQRFFNDGPVTKTKKISTVLINSGGINTREIDQYRQGIEITTQHHHGAGIVRSLSGEPGHMIRLNRYGMNKNNRTALHYAEPETFNPVSFLTQQSNDTFQLESIAFPIFISDLEISKNYELDGTIEPLSIREVASFFSTETPFIFRSVKGILSTGNTDVFMRTDKITSLNDLVASNIPFLDLLDMFEFNIPMGGYTMLESSTIESFDDSVNKNIIDDNYDIDLLGAINDMTPATENFINVDEKSTVSGWEYDTIVGTDSITFGGMTY